MTSRHTIRTAGLLVGCLLLAASYPGARAGEGGIWTTDFSAATTSAQRQDKDLLVLFTGTDWCVWCQRLESEVFSKKTFQGKVTDHFVPVFLDFPRRSAQSEELRKQNRALMQKYGVSGFPTVYLMTPEGEPYARTGYQAGGAEAYLAHLETLRERGAEAAELRRAADQAEGAERARLLGQWLEATEGLGVEVDRRPVYEEMLRLLPEDEKAERQRIEGELFLLGFLGRIGPLLQGNQPDKALALIDAALAEEKDLSAGIRQQLHYIKAVIHYRNGQNDAAADAAKAGIALVEEGEGAAQLRGLLQAIQADGGGPAH